MPDKAQTQDKSKTQMPTLTDVARRAKVSTATVSRCLNAPDRVVEKTRKRVLEAVAELGYTPHFGAPGAGGETHQHIRGNRADMENAIFARGLQAFQEVLEHRGHHAFGGQFVLSSGFGGKADPYAGGARSGCVAADRSGSPSRGLCVSATARGALRDGLGARSRWRASLHRV